MATVESTNYGKPPRAGINGTISWGGRYNADNLAPSSTIKLAKIPAGVEVHGFQLFNEQLGVNCTISVGLSTAPTIFAASIDGNTARTGMYFPITPTVLAADVDLQVITAAVTADGLVGGFAVYTPDPAAQA